MVSGQSFGDVSLYGCSLCERLCGVMVSTLAFEFDDPRSNPRQTFSFFIVSMIVCLFVSLS